MVGSVLLGVAGASDIGAGIALLLTPTWFYEHIGPYSPFNQHYEGDAGSFVIGIGLCLVVAALRPVGSLRLVLVAAVASGLHLANHLYATFYLGASWGSTAVVAVQLVLVVAGGVVLRRQLWGPHIR